MKLKRKLFQKVPVAAKPQPMLRIGSPNGRWLVTVGDTDAEVVVTPDGVIVSADEPLEDWVGDAWSDLAGDAKLHGWKVFDLLSPEPMPAKVAVEVKEEIVDLAAADPSKIRQFTPNQNIAIGSGATAIAKGSIGIGGSATDKVLTSVGPGQMPKWQTVAADPGVWGSVAPSDPSAWNMTAAGLEKRAREAELKQEAAVREMEKLRREYAIAVAKEGGGIDEMNKALFPNPARPVDEEQFKRRLLEVVRDEVVRAVRSVAEYHGITDKEFRTIEEHVYRASEDRLRREFMMARPDLDPRAKPTPRDAWKDYEAWKGI